MLTVERRKLAPPVERAEDVGRLLSAVADIERESGRPGLHALFATLAYTGCRRGEALGLRWCDVDLDRRILAVRRSYAGPTKSGKHRTVPIAPPLADILRVHRASAAGDLVFPDASGKMHSPNAKLEDVLFSALERIGHPRIRVHDLRHVFASHFVMSGGDIFTLQRILGHSSPQLTSDTYAHLSSGHMATAADRVSFAASEPAKP
jgi:integrase